MKDRSPAVERRVLGTVSPALYRWLIEGEAFPAAGARLLRRYAWNRLFYRMHLGLQGRLSTAPPLVRPPLFVLGLWRSGTTYLHELLAAHPALCSPRTWQCMAPASFAITGRPPASAMIQRPMDEITVSAESPQEDEFALMMLGCPSVYRGFLDPRRLPALEELLTSHYWEQFASASWPHEPLWMNFLATVNAMEGTERRLLLKSPNHSFRMPALLARFPAAPCIWITRDSHDILVSNLKMWRSMVGVYGLTDIPEGVLEHFLVQALGHAARELESLSRILPPTQFVVVNLEKLNESPLETTVTALERLGIPCDQHAVALIRDAVGAPAWRSMTRYGRVGEPSYAGDVLSRLTAAQESALRSHGC